MERIYNEIRRDMKSTLTIEDVKDILRKQIKRSQTHSNYFSYLGVHRRNDTSVGEGIRTLQYEEDKLNNRNKSDYDSEVKKILLREGFKIENDNLYFKRLFRQLKENLIEVKYRSIKWKRDILLGQKKSEWDLVDDLMEELKDEIVQSAVVNQKLTEGVEHPAPFPEKIVILPVLQTTNEGDLVLDPFCGSMTTGKVSERFNRQFVGYDVQVY